MVAKKLDIEEIKRMVEKKIDVWQIKEASKVTMRKDLTDDIKDAYIMSFKYTMQMIVEPIVCVFLQPLCSWLIH